MRTPGNACLSADTENGALILYFFIQSPPREVNRKNAASNRPLEPGYTDGLLSGLWTEGYSPHAWIRYEKVPLPHPIASSIYKMGGEKLSPITVDREGAIRWGEESFTKVDYGTTALRYRLTGLEPARTYCVGAGFYQKSGSAWEQTLTVNGKTLTLEIPSGELIYNDSAVPVDGVSSINITVERVDGDTAVLSYIALFEVGGDGGAQSAAPTPLPHALTLLRNHPNPFSRTTTIHYALPGCRALNRMVQGRGAEEQSPEPYGSGQRGDSSTYPFDSQGSFRATRLSSSKSEGQRMNLSVYDLSGRLVRTLIDQPSAHPTIQLSNQVIWDGKDDSGRPVASGVYFCRLEMGGSSATTKIAVLR